MILKHFDKYSIKYREHLIEMQKRISEKDKEAIELALYYISYYKELNTLLLEQYKKMQTESFLINRDHSTISYYLKKEYGEVKDMKIKLLKKYQLKKIKNHGKNALEKSI